MPRSTVVKFGLDVGKKSAAGRQLNVRSKKKLVDEEIDIDSDGWPSDDSEDGDYEASNVEADSNMKLDIEDEYIVREEDVPDNIHEKTYEDYLDRSHVLDKMYKNGKIWSHLPFGSIVLEEWLILKPKHSF